MCMSIILFTLCSYPCDWIYCWMEWKMILKCKQSISREAERQREKKTRNQRAKRIKRIECAHDCNFNSNFAPNMAMTYYLTHRDAITPSAPCALCSVRHFSLSPSFSFWFSCQCNQISGIKKYITNEFDKQLASFSDCESPFFFAKFVTLFTRTFFFHPFVSVYSNIEQYQNGSQSMGFDWTNNLLTSVSITVIDVEIMAFFQFETIRVIGRFFALSLSFSSSLFLRLSPAFRVSRPFLTLHKNQCKFLKIKLIQFLTCHIWSQHIYTYTRRSHNKKSIHFNDVVDQWYWVQNMETWSNRESRIML